MIIVKDIKYWLHKNFRIFQKYKQIGENCTIAKSSRISNEKYMIIGNEANIGEYSVLSCYDVYRGKKLNPSLQIGDHFFARERLTILCAGEIRIGNNVTCGGYVFISDENHGIDASTPNYLDNDLEVKNITIQNGVWIGEKVIILPGVSIGEKSIIGAGSVVTKSIPSYVVAAGNPCRVIRELS